jgi:hypothetical protein
MRTLRIRAPKIEPLPQLDRDRHAVPFTTNGNPPEIPKHHV